MSDDAPRRIFAEIIPYDFPGFSPCWVWHHPESMEDGRDGMVEYVRSDAIEALQAEVARLRAVLEAIADVIPKGVPNYSHVVWKTTRAALAQTREGGEG